MEHDGEFLTTREIAAMAGVSQQLVREYCDAGWVPCIRVGDVRLLRRAAVSAVRLLKASRVAEAHRRFSLMRRARPPA